MNSLKHYKISEKYGFALDNPLTHLMGLNEWLDVAQNLSELLKNGLLKQTILKLPSFDLRYARSYKEYRLARLVLATLAQGVVWEDLHFQGYPCQHIPRNLAVPLYDVSAYLGINPVLTYSDTCLVNYSVIDTHLPVHMTNCDLTFKLDDSDDFKWFFLVALQTELDFAKHGLAALREVKKYLEVQAGTVEHFVNNIHSLAKALQVMSSTIHEMFNRVEPNAFYDTVRPFMMGWGDSNDNLTQAEKFGVVLDGVSEELWSAYGPSAVQSSIIPCFDTILGIIHPLEKAQYLATIREYMPIEHRIFLEDLASGLNLKTFIESNDLQPDNEIVQAYNECVDGLCKFRRIHLQLATRYIMIPANRRKLKCTGTAGSDVIPFLKGLLSDTRMGHLK